MNLFDKQSHEFSQRHIGINKAEEAEMLARVGVGSLNELIDKTVPPAIRMQEELDLPEAMSEFEYLQHLKDISLKNKLFKKLHWPGLLRYYYAICNSTEYF